MYVICRECLCLRHKHKQLRFFAVGVVAPSTVHNIVQDKTRVQQTPCACDPFPRPLKIQPEAWTLVLSSATCGKYFTYVRSAVGEAAQGLGEEALLRGPKHTAAHCSATASADEHSWAEHQGRYRSLMVGNSCIPTRTKGCCKQCESSSTDHKHNE